MGGPAALRVGSRRLVPLFLIAQATAAPQPGSAASALARPCAAGPEVDGDVVVCGHSRGADRLKPMPVPAPDKRLDATSFRLPGGMTGGFHASQSSLPGASSPGIGASLSLPLGRKRRFDGEVR